MLVLVFCTFFQSVLDLMWIDLLCIFYLNLFYIMYCVTWGRLETCPTGLMSGVSLGGLSSFTAFTL